MIIQLDSPEDSFDLLEVLRFEYKAKIGQVSNKTLSVKVKKYKENSDGSFSYSDEPPIDIFIKDLDQHVEDSTNNGNPNHAAALGACMLSVSDLCAEIKGISASIV